jgi:DNA-directed RNA polymerase specialized sigma24 family protein
MAAEGSRSFFRLNAVDRHGRRIDPVVLAAAEEVYPRAFAHGLRLLGDPAVVTDLLEEVAADVSQTIKTKDPPGDLEPIRNLPGYIFTTFKRRVNTLKHKELMMLEAAAAVNASKPAWTDPSRQLELKILLDEFLAQFDSIIQDMLCRYLVGFSWKEIGEVHGLSAHAAETRFSHAVQQARERLKI